MPKSQATVQKTSYAFLTDTLIYDATVSRYLMVSVIYDRCGICLYPRLQFRKPYKPLSLFHEYMARSECSILMVGVIYGCYMACVMYASITSFSSDNLIRLNY